MKLSDVPSTLWRRWYLTLVGLLATAAVCAGAMFVVPPSQQVTASVLLLPPQSTVGIGGNPYLGLGGLGETVDILARTLSSKSTHEQIEKVWPDAEFTVEPDIATSGPILVVSVDDSSTATSLAVTSRLLELIPITLENLQQSLGIRERAHITSTVLTRDEEPTTIRKDQLRVLVGLAALGLAATSLGVALIDGLLTERRRGSAVAPASKLRKRKGPSLSSNLPLSEAPQWDWRDSDPATPMDSHSAHPTEELTQEASMARAKS